VNGDHVTVLDTKVVANDTVDASASVIKVLISEDNENCVFSLLSSDQDGVAAEELQGVHGGFGEGDNAVVIIDGIGNPNEAGQYLLE
jgi:hypothetical protein